MTTTTKFDLDGLRSAIEARDAQAQAALYADDAEVTLVDSEHPPSNPIRLRGRDAIAQWLEDTCARDMNHRVTHAVAGDTSGGYTISCEYPSGQRVACAALFELRDGRIAAMDGVQAWDE